MPNYPPDPRDESTREKGKSSESYAHDYLVKKGFKIIKQNFHFGRYGEIDIIAEDDGCLVFVEVKSRYSDKFADPLEYITPQKVKNIRRTAEGYLYVNNITDRVCRFDVVTLDFTKSSPTVRHIVNAFS
jgi:putative endonuclease